MFNFFKKNKPLTRKERTEKFLRKKDIKINHHLPRIESEEETTIRTAKEIAERVTALATVSLVAFNNFTGEEAKEYLAKYQLSRLFTPKEVEFLDNPTEEKKIQETWRCEGIWTLMWALKMVDDLGFPDTLCDLNSIPENKYPIGIDKDPNDFIHAMKESRTLSEILDASDLYYRLDWACVDARLNGRQMLQVHPSIVYERHYALNWLTNYMNQDWDDISCDT